MNQIKVILFRNKYNHFQKNLKGHICMDIMLFWYFYGKSLKINLTFYVFK